MDTKNLFVLLIFALIYSAASSPSRVKRMIGGEPAWIKDYPYLVFLGNNHFSCAGAIISRYHVLTAAKCVRKSPDQLIIRAGSKYWNEGGSLHHLESVMKHEGFFVDDMDLKSYSDIAVVKVKEPFEYSRKVQSIPLPEAGDKIEPLAMGKSASWGKTAHAYPAKKLRKMDFFVTSRNICNEMVKSLGAEGLEPDQFCALDGDPDRYICIGDSGSPLVVNGKLAGITIYGGGCETKYYMGVYTDVSYYRDWIDQRVTYD